MADETTGTATENANNVTQQLENVVQAADQVADAASATRSAASNMDVIMDVNLHVIVEVGKARMTVQDLLQLGQGSVIELEKLAGEPLDIFVNGKYVARGEAVIVNEKFGVRVTEIISQEQRIQTFG